MLLGAFYGRPHHQKRPPSPQKVQVVLPLFHHPLEPAPRLPLLYLNPGGCWTLVHKHNEEMPINRANDHAGQPRSPIDLHLQAIHPARPRVVQPASLPGVSPGPLCPLLLSTPPKTRREHSGLPKAGPQGHNLLQNGGKLALQLQRINHPAQCQLLNPRTVPFASTQKHRQPDRPSRPYQLHQQRRNAQNLRHRRPPLFLLINIFIV
jgi:hypothetical protein